MRKLMHSKKGFTLVELMIVVVIMGILVAVAVPVYGAVTKNAEKKTCVSNLRIMKSNASSFYMSGGKDGSQLQLGTSSTTSLTSNSSYLKLFDGGALPKCPSEGVYTAAISTDASGIATYVMTCSKGTDLGHVLG